MLPSKVVRSLAYFSRNSLAVAGSRSSSREGSELSALSCELHCQRIRICSATASRRLLELLYNGQRRLIEPYSHGFSRAGQEMLVGF